MLLDTSGLLSLIHRDEPQHEEAKRLYQAALARVTHNDVLDEFVALAHARKLPRYDALDISTSLLDSANVEVVWVDEPLHRRALDLLSARLDKTYSLCDAVSFVLMRERGETEALTTDRHFEQEGLVRLLVP
jgi:predicted nucleic acid-binding protein